MNNLLYTVAVLFILLWAIGYFAYSVGGMIHILLIIAVISFIVRILQGNRALPRDDF
ncbi:MAG: lmo0937 family membrane protein [Ignavibacteria bacterium]|nr:lmo0937 family membrane protein [Ignavibacteria bacterium]